MNYTIYIGNDCHQCGMVLDYMAQRKICAQIINIDTENKQPPFTLYVFPALFNDDTLIAYGEDIIEHFNNKT